MDRVDDYAGGSIYTLNCFQGERSEYARDLFSEEQEIACMQLIWLAFRAEMKYYENVNETDSFWIRSDCNDKLAKNIDRIHQIDEIEGKIPDIKNMLIFQLNCAEGLGIMNTAEYKEANQKMNEIKIIEDKLKVSRKRIINEHRCWNFVISLATIATIILVTLAVYYYAKRPDMTLVIKQRMAEKRLYTYTISHMNKMRNNGVDHMIHLDTYVKRKFKNQKHMKKELNKENCYYYLYGSFTSLLAEAAPRLVK